MSRPVTVPPRPPPLPRSRRWENKDIYAAAIRSLRLRELQNAECVTAVRAGLGAVIPLQLLTTLSPLEMELRTCGLPYINLEFLKVGGRGPVPVRRVSQRPVPPPPTSQLGKPELVGCPDAAGSSSHPGGWPPGPGS